MTAFSAPYILINTDIATEASIFEKFSSPNEKILDIFK